jgi:hypothetical protein
MLIHQIVVQFGIQTEVSVTQGTIWPSVCVCINIQERKVAVWLSLHSELDVGMYAVQIVIEII